MSADLLALLDQLDEARASIGDSPAFRVIGLAQDDEFPEQVLARFDDGGMSVFAECYGADAARLIVAAVNTLPQLTGALRAVLDLALDFEGDAAHWGPEWGQAADRIRDTITAALTPESVQP